MGKLILNPASIVWLGLVVATGASWWMGTGTGNPRHVTTAVIIVALVKTRFVLRYFMEVRLAPAVLKYLADAWVVLVCAAILALYWNLF